MAAAAPHPIARLVTQATAVQYFQSLTNLNAVVAAALAAAGPGAPAGLPTTAAGIAMMGTNLINIPVDDIFASSFLESFGRVGEQVPRFRVGHVALAGGAIQSYVSCLARSDFVSIIDAISTHAADCQQHAGEAKDEAAPKILLIRGPVGMGKSHGLLYDVSCRRLNVNNRVVYIPDCASWVDENVRTSTVFLLETIVLAFACELPAAPIPVPNPPPPAGLTLQEQQQDLFNYIFDRITAFKTGQIPQGQEHAVIEDVLARCSQHCLLQGKQMYIYFDQHNNIKDELLEKNPYKVGGMARIPGFCRSGGVMIACVSANNNQVERRLSLSFRGAVDFQYLSRYSDAELVSWLQRALPALNPAAVAVDRAQVRVSSAFTNHVPLEVTLLCETIAVQLAVPVPAGAPTPTAAQILAAANIRFQVDRVTAMARIDDQFVAKLTTSKSQSDYERSKMWMAAGVLNGDQPDPQVPTTINQLLMYYPAARGCPYLMALTPAAESALTLRTSEESRVAFDAHVKEILTNDKYTQDTKGRIFELYITELMKDKIRQSARPIELRIRRLNNDGFVHTGLYGYLTGFPLVLDFSRMKLVEFYHNHLPPARSFDTRLTTLLKPKSSNYPSFDFFIWSPAHQSLLSFSVAINLAHHGFNWPPLLGGVAAAAVTRDVEWENYLNAEILHYENRVGHAELHHVWLAHKQQRAPVASRNHASERVWMLSTSKLVKSAAFPMLQYLNP